MLTSTITSQKLNTTNMAELQAPKNPKYLVFFHNGCPDGVCAAAVAERFVFETESKRGPELLQLVPTDPGKVGDVLTKAHEKFPDAQNVFMFDIALRQPDFDKLLELFPKAQAFDHHLTSVDVQRHPQFELDTRVSGAELAWRHFYPNVKQPALVDYIGDRDTWKWKLPNSREIAKYMTGHLPTTMVQYPTYIVTNPVWLTHLLSDNWVTAAVSEGAALAQYENTLLKRMAARHVACMINNKLVAVLEASELQSEVGELLYNAEGKLEKEFHGIPAGTSFRYSYVIMWCYDNNDGMIRLSLRSGHTPFKVVDGTGSTVWDGPADVEKIAAVAYKGGGHKAAAGGKCTVQQLMEYILGTRAPTELRINV